MYQEYLNYCKILTRHDGASRESAWSKPRPRAEGLGYTVAVVGVTMWLKAKTG